MLLAVDLTILFVLNESILKQSTPEAHEDVSSPDLHAPAGCPSGCVIACVIDGVNTKKEAIMENIAVTNVAILLLLFLGCIVQRCKLVSNRTRKFIVGK